MSHNSTTSGTPRSNRGNANSSSRASSSSRGGGRVSGQKVSHRGIMDRASSGGGSEKSSVVDPAESNSSAQAASEHQQQTQTLILDLGVPSGSPPQLLALGQFRSAAEGRHPLDGSASDGWLTDGDRNHHSGGSSSVAEQSMSRGSGLQSSTLSKSAGQGTLGSSTGGTNTAGKKKKSSRRSKSHREWCCQVCGNMNYGHRTKCHMSVCGAPKDFPGPYKTTPTGPKNKFNHQVAKVKKLNWTCPRCGNENRSLRDVCHSKGCSVERIWSQDGQMSFKEMNRSSSVTAGGCQRTLPAIVSPLTQQQQQQLASISTQQSLSTSSLVGPPAPLGAALSSLSSATDTSPSASLGVLHPNVAPPAGPLHPAVGFSQVNSSGQSNSLSLTNTSSSQQTPLTTTISGSAALPPGVATAIAQGGNQVVTLTAQQLQLLTQQIHQQATQQQLQQQQPAPQQQPQQHHQASLSHQQQLTSVYQQQEQPVSSSQHGQYVDPLRLPSTSLSSSGQPSLMMMTSQHQQQQQPVQSPLPLTNVATSAPQQHPNASKETPLFSNSMSQPPEGALFQTFVPTHLQNSMSSSLSQPVSGVTPLMQHSLPSQLGSSTPAAALGIVNPPHAASGGSHSSSSATGGTANSRNTLTSPGSTLVLGQSPAAIAAVAGQSPGKPPTGPAARAPTHSFQQPNALQFQHQAGASTSSLPVGPDGSFGLFSVIPPAFASVSQHPNGASMSRPGPSISMSTSQQTQLQPQ